MRRFGRSVRFDRETVVRVAFEGLPTGARPRGAPDLRDRPTAGLEKALWLDSRGSSGGSDGVALLPHRLGLSLWGSRCDRQEQGALLRRLLLPILFFKPAGRYPRRTR